MSANWTEEELILWMKNENNYHARNDLIEVCKAAPCYWYGYMGLIDTFIIKFGARK